MELNTSQSHPIMLETIAIRNGVVQNLSYHLKRMKASGFIPKTIMLDIPNDCLLGVVKCRIIYRQSIDSLCFEKYNLRRIEQVKLVEANNLSYNRKYANRESLNAFVNQYPLADDIIFIKQGLVTDSSFANIVIDYKGTLLTPKNPLLNGTKRQWLLDNKKIQEEDISVDMLLNANAIFYINAMIELGEFCIKPSNILI